MTVEVTVEQTRNEHSVIFKLNKTLLPPGTGRPFSNREAAASDPLAKSLFEIPGVASLWFIGSEVQVTKTDTARWGTLRSKIVETLKRLDNSL